MKEFFDTLISSGTFIFIRGRLDRPEFLLRQSLNAKRFLHVISNADSAWTKIICHRGQFSITLKTFCPLFFFSLRTKHVDGGDVDGFNGMLLKKKAVFFKEGDDEWGVFDGIESSGRLKRSMYGTKVMG